MSNCVIGLDLGGTRIKMGLVIDNQITAKAVLDLPSSDYFEPVLPLIENQIQQLLHESGAHSIDAIGMAFPTIVDSDNKQLLYQYVKYRDANNIDLEEWAGTKWNASFAMENDARAALVGEWRAGAGKSCNNLVMITIGTGIGTAALIQGNLLKGSHYLAGNLGGHMIINHDGHKCNCGNIGCTESEASSWALPEIIKRFPGYQESEFSKGATVDFETVFDLASKGDSFATKVRNHCLDVWSTIIQNLIYAYDPEKVIIGGGVMNSADIILPWIKNRMGQAAWLPKDAVQFESAKQPDWAGVIGMAWLANHTL